MSNWRDPIADEWINSHLHTAAERLAQSKYKDGSHSVFGNYRSTKSLSSSRVSRFFDNLASNATYLCPVISSDPNFDGLLTGLELTGRDNATGQQCLKVVSTNPLAMTLKTFNQGTFNWKPNNGDVQNRNILYTPGTSGFHYESNSSVSDSGPCDRPFTFVNNAITRETVATFVRSQFTPAAYSFNRRVPTTMAQLESFRAAELSAMLAHFAREETRMAAVLAEVGNRVAEISIRPIPTVTVTARWAGYGGGSTKEQGRYWRLPSMTLATAKAKWPKAGAESFTETLRSPTGQPYSGKTYNRIRVIESLVSNVVRVASRYKTSLDTEYDLANNKLSSAERITRLEIMEYYNDLIDTLQTGAIEKLMSKFPSIDWDFGSLLSITNVWQINVIMSACLDANTYNSYPIIPASSDLGVKVGFEYNGAKLGAEELYNSFVVQLARVKSETTQGLGASALSRLPVGIKNAIESRIMKSVVDELINTLKQYSVSSNVWQNFSNRVKASDMYEAYTALSKGSSNANREHYDSKIVSLLRRSGQYHRGSLIVTHSSMVGETIESIPGSIGLHEIVDRSKSFIIANSGKRGSGDSFFLNNYDDVLLALAAGGIVVGSLSDSTFATFLLGAKAYGFNAVLLVAQDQVKLAKLAGVEYDALIKNGSKLTREHLRKIKREDYIKMCINRDKLFRSRVGTDWQGIKIKKHFDLAQFWDKSRSGNPKAFTTALG